MAKFFRNPLRIPAVSLLLITVLVLSSAGRPAPAPQPKIQVAILLDVSGSMNGLIEQAKAQLWNMVSVMGKAKCDGTAPKIEIALYEYGRPENLESTGYVKQVTPFTTDLDGLSQSLFALKTSGGDEYCGEVIYQSLDQLKWDADTSSYKVIFIAGNEDFLQGARSYTIACNEARKRGVLVNTIYCGPREQGIREHWNLGGECGGGSFTNINSNARSEDIPTPYDSILYVLNNSLNDTYIAYGKAGTAGYARQRQMDMANEASNKSAMAKRVAVKAGKVYNNAEWDIIDAMEADSNMVTRLDRSLLVDSLQKKTDTQLRSLIQQKKKERENIQNNIRMYAVKRSEFITAERVRSAAAKSEPTLETEIEKIIRSQAGRYRMVFE